MSQPSDEAIEEAHRLMTTLYFSRGHMRVSGPGAHIKLVRKPKGKIGWTMNNPNNWPVLGVYTKGDLTCSALAHDIEAIMAEGIANS